MLFAEAWVDRAVNLIFFLTAWRLLSHHISSSTQSSDIRCWIFCFGDSENHVMMPEFQVICMSARTRLRELIRELEARHANLEENADSYDKRDVILRR